MMTHPWITAQLNEQHRASLVADAGRDRERRHLLARPDANGRLNRRGRPRPRPDRLRFAPSYRIALQSHPATEEPHGTTWAHVDRTTVTLNGAACHASR